MGFALPEYEEIPISVTMTAAQDAMYESLKDQLMTELRERLVRNDRSLLAGYLQALLSWPDSPWRKKVVRDPKTEEIIAQIPGLDADQLYPKEEYIINCWFFFFVLYFVQLRLYFTCNGGTITNPDRIRFVNETKHELI